MNDSRVEKGLDLNLYTTFTAMQIVLINVVLRRTAIKEARVGWLQDAVA